MRLLLIIYLTFYPLILFTQEDIRQYSFFEGEDLNKKNLNGMVEYVDFKSFDKDKFQFKDSIIKENRPYTYYHHRNYFDSIGRIKRTITYSNNIIIEYKYDSLNRLNQSIEIELNSSEKKIMISYNWIKTDSSIQLTQFETDSLLSNEKIIYNYFLNDNHHIFKMMKYKDGKYLGTYTFKYNSMNQIIQSTWLGLKGRIVHEWYYFYDIHGNLIKKIKVNGDGIENETCEFEYDIFNNLTLDKRSRGNSVRSEITWEYEYDDYNNWVKAIQKVNGNSKRISIREIVYY